MSETKDISLPCKIFAIAAKRRQDIQQYDRHDDWSNLEEEHDLEYIPLGQIYSWSTYCYPDESSWLIMFYVKGAKLPYVIPRYFNTEYEAMGRLKEILLTLDNQ